MKKLGHDPSCFDYEEKVDRLLTNAPTAKEEQARSIHAIPHDGGNCGEAYSMRLLGGLNPLAEWMWDTGRPTHWQVKVLERSLSVIRSRVPSISMKREDLVITVYENIDELGVFMLFRDSAKARSISRMADWKDLLVDGYFFVRLDKKTLAQISPPLKERN